MVESWVSPVSVVWALVGTSDGFSAAASAEDSIQRSRRWVARIAAAPVEGWFFVTRFAYNTKWHETEAKEFRYR